MVGQEASKLRLAGNISNNNYVFNNASIPELDNAVVREDHGRKWMGCSCG